MAKDVLIDVFCIVAFFLTWILSSRRPPFCSHVLLVSTESRPHSLQSSHENLRRACRCLREQASDAREPEPRGRPRAPAEGEEA